MYFYQNFQFHDGLAMGAAGLPHYKQSIVNFGSQSRICRSKTRNNALDVVWGFETIILPLSRQHQTKSFCPTNPLPCAKFSVRHL